MRARAVGVTRASRCVIRARLSCGLVVAGGWEEEGEEDGELVRA